MTEYIVDSWGSEQLARLRVFFMHEAKAGDSVIFDEALARDNAPSHEGLDDQRCNSFVYSSANKALADVEEERIKMLTDPDNGLTLTTRAIHAMQPAQLVENTAPEEDLWADDPDLDLDLIDPPRQDHDREAEGWAKSVAAYHAR